MASRPLSAVAAAALLATAGSAGAEDAEYRDYFNSYAHPDIHRQMLQDRPRTEAYAAALSRTPEVVRGKTVLDFGCGTGILSLFAARAGAERVICVEGSDLAATTERVVAKNNLSSVVRVLKTTHAKLELPAKVDVIVSEWMGYAMVMEDMLDDLLYVRDRWLKPGGVVWPRFAQLWLQLYGDAEWWSENMGYWESQPYGIDLSPVADYAYNQTKEWPWPIRGQWRPAGLTGQPHLVCQWDLQEFDLPKSFRVSSKFRETSDAVVHGLLVWFDVIFDHPEENLTLSTHPDAGVQHWGQVFWPLKGAPLSMPGLTVEGVFRMKRSPPAWDFGLKWRAPPLATRPVEASAPGLLAEHFAQVDEWTVRRSLEGFLENGGRGRGAAAPPAARAARSQRIGGQAEL